MRSQAVTGVLVVHPLPRGLPSHSQRRKPGPVESSSQERGKDTRMAWKRVHAFFPKSRLEGTSCTSFTYVPNCRLVTLAQNVLHVPCPSCRATCPRRMRGPIGCALLVILDHRHTKPLCIRRPLPLCNAILRFTCVTCFGWLLY